MLPLLLALGCTPEPPPPRLCNGLPELCGRRFDEVAVAMTHNAMSSEDAGFWPPNQDHGVDQQLADGVRGFMLDVHPYEGEAWLCHGECGLGRTRLAEGLAAYSAFFATHPDDVLVLMLESYVNPAWVEAAFEEAGLAQRAAVQAPDAPWPTLTELLDGGTPLVVFTQDEGGDAPWLLAGYRDFVWDTPYAARTPEDLSCAPLRGDPSRPIFLLNHFLSAPIALTELAEQVNHEPFLSDRIHQCSAQAGQRVDWVAVDFYGIGDVLAAVERLNRE